MAILNYVFLLFIVGLALTRSSNVTFIKIAIDDRLSGFVPDSGFIKRTRYIGNDKVSCGTSCISMTDCVSYFLDTSTSQCQYHDTILENTAGLTVSATSLYFVVGSGCRGDWVNFEDSCFFFETWAITNYEQTKTFCEQKGGNILYINNAAESKFIREHLQSISYSANGFWVGLWDVQSPGTWLWDDTGLPASYTDWDVEQPELNSEHCAAIYYNNRWHDLNCAAMIHAACRI